MAMTDESTPHISLQVPPPRIRRSSATSAHSSSAEDDSTPSNPSRRPRSSTTSKNVSSSPGASSDRLRRRQSTKPTSSGPREGLSHGTTAAMPSTTAPVGEITYTPTTHRISKAKKGKKVHACEHPGCTKIFTRAEHRKRHEANHNSEPAYQCWVQECRKPFQRSDLLARHMERQHNMPSETFAARRGSPRSTRETSFTDSNPSTSGNFASQVSQQRMVPSQLIPPPNSNGAMSIHYISHQPLNDLSHGPIGPVPRNLPSDLHLFQIPASAESPLYSSSGESSCYSPSSVSEFLQPQVSTPQFLNPESMPRSQTTGLESCFQNQQLFTSPLPLTPTVPTWEQFEDSALGISYDSPCTPNIRQYQYPSPTWMGANGFPYEMNLPPQQFESKSSRAKGIAFHPKRPWILVSLHSSTIQLWDYRMGTLIDRFEEHDGPVRGIDFHKTQPLFVSGGDDYKIKVWSYQSRRCLFTLNGHLDYVRTVFFHHELPWILSSSDDQTIRIWNWQNRSLICTMTGHNHYTMCAQFHPKDDLIVSASLDQSVRVWDISGLRKKHSAPTSMTFEDQMSRANSNQADMFGNTDAVVKFVLEGHDRGVNWVAFHPTLPLIVSAGDDRLVKLWRMSETKAWEVDTCRGHFQNCSATLFHPHQDLILSVGEDKTIRVWDLNKRTSVQSFKRENDRFWVIAAHPEINLFAAGHDNGVMVFKLERERPASAIYQNNLFYITKEKNVRSYDFSKNIESPSLLSLKKLGSPWLPPRTLSYNPAERAILVTSPADSGTYELVNLPRDASGAVEPTDMKKGQGSSAIFVARNRFAVFTQASQQIDVKDLANSTTKTIKPPPGTTDIYFGGTGCLLLTTPAIVVLYDIQQKKQIAELAVTGVKYVVWSSDGLYAALLSKHNVTIVTKSLEQVSTLHETIRIKSAAWDDAGVLLYSTLNHIKYTLLNGDSGIVRTLDQTVYLVRVKARSVYCLDRASKPKVLDVDPTEYRFKLALVKRNYEEMLQIIKTSSLVGQSIISYLQKKGYPEIALQFVQDPQTRFELAIECGNLDVAVEMAKQLDRPKLWSRLGTEALSHGNHQIVEMTYQKLRSFDKLSFLYLATGDEEKLARMAKIAEHRGDFTSRFQNALYMGDIQNRIQMFQEIDLYPLAYMTAKAHGLDDQCEAILEASGMTQEQINLPTMGQPLEPPKAIVPTYKTNWPAKAASHSFFEQALLGEVEGADDEVPTSNGLYHDEVAEEEATARDGQLGDEEEDAAGWDMGDDLNVEVESDFVNVDSADAGAGSSDAELWARNSPLAADHVAGGSFETAMQLLNRQVGAVNFAPLKSRFLEIYQATKTFLPATPGLPPLVNYVRRTIDETDSRKVLPIIPRDLESIASVDLQEVYGAMRSNKLEDGLKICQRILHALLVNAVSTQQQVGEAKKIISTASEYATAMELELARRALPADGDANLKRSLELSAYFTIPKLEVAHRQLALMAAMKLAFTNKNYSSALSFANRMLANGGSAKLLDQAKKIKATCERSPQDKTDIEFDQFAEFDVCASSYTPIYSGSPSAACPFDGSKHQAPYKGKVCPVCEVCEIGAPASGIRLFV